MNSIISSLSFRVYNHKDYSYNSNIFDINDKDIEIKIQGTYCGGYSNVKCHICNLVDPQCPGHWYTIKDKNIYLYNKAYEPFLTKLSGYMCFHHKGLIIPDIYNEDTPPSIITKHFERIKTNGICGVCQGFIRGFNITKKDDSLKFNIRRGEKKFLKNTYEVGKAKTIDDIFVNPKDFYEICLNIPQYYMNAISSTRLNALVHISECFTIGYLSIMPSYLRQATKHEKHNDYAHYITNKYLEMISIIRDMSNYNDENDPIKTKQLKILQIRLQICYNEMIDGKESVDPKQESATAYLKGKANLFRESINGNRSPKTARVVLNTNIMPNLSSCYMCVQYVQNINPYMPYNMFTDHIIKDLLEKGLIKGFYSCNRGTYYSPKYIHSITPGDFFEVPFNVGDSLVIAGRQPSLHATNIAVCKSKTPEKRPYINSQTTQLPTCLLPGMNGDQDGDEVWSKEVSGPMTKYEQQYIMFTPNNILSNGHGGINYGLIQDELLSVNAILNNNNFNLYEAIMLLGPYVKYLNIKYDSNKIKFTGRELLSIVIPSEINKIHIIKNGIIQHSRLRSADVGVGSGTVKSIAKTLYEYKPIIAKQFIQSILRISKSFITNYPQGITLKDLTSDVSEWSEINIIKDKLYEQIEENYNRYRTDVRLKKIIPMNNDALMKFIKLEIAKVVGEITKGAENIISKHMENYNNHREYNRIVLYLLAEFKMDYATLSIIYSQANPSIELSNHYLQRVFPCYKVNENSLSNLGLIKNSIINGLNIRDMVLLAAKARENVVTTVCMTASKGEIGRNIVKNLENYVISHLLKFVMNGNSIMDPCLNVYKMPVKRLCVVDVDYLKIKAWSNDSSDLLAQEIRLWYGKILRYIYDFRNNKIEKTLAYIVDIHMIIDTFTNEVIIDTNEVIRLVNEYFDYIEYNYLFSLGRLDTLRLITFYSIRLHNGITEKALNHLFQAITDKYNLYPEEGLPVGMEAATSISEVETQSSLSAHLQFTKSGGDVKNAQQSSNINLMRINVKKLGLGSNVMYMKSIYKEDLQVIRAGLEYITLEDITLGLTFDPYMKGESSRCKITMKLSRKSMNMLIIEPRLLERMIAEFIDTCDYIDLGQLCLTDMSEEYYIYECKIILADVRYIPILKLTFSRCVSKGVFSLYRYSLESIIRIDPVTLDSYIEWLMIAELSSITNLSDYDTSRITIIPTIEVLHTHIGTLNGYNMLASNYNSNGLMRFHTHLLSKNQFRDGEIKRTHKNHGKDMSTISKVAFMTPLKDLQEAALKKLTEPVNDVSSRILMGMPIKIGTGHSDTYIDLTPYLNMKNNKVINDIIV